MRTTASGGLTGGLLVVLGLLMTTNPFASSIYLPALPALAADLDVPPAGAQLVYTSFLLGVAVGQLVVGMAADAFGRRRALLTGLALLTIASLGAAAAPGLPALVVARVVQGLGAAAGVVVVRAVVSDLATGRRAARIYSILMGILAAGPFLAPLLGTVALQVGGWRGTFVALAVFGAVAVTAAWAMVPETLRPELRTPARLRPLFGNYVRLLRDPAYVGSALAMAFGFAALSVHSAASSFVAQGILGVGPWGFSVIYMLFALAMLCGSMANAFFAGRFGPRGPMLVWQLTAVAASGTLLAFAVWGPFTLASFLPTVLVSGAASSAILANASAMTLARAGFAAASGAALMGALQSVAGSAAAPIGGIDGARTAVPMAAGMLGCLVLSILATQIGRRLALRFPRP